MQQKRRPYDARITCSYDAPDLPQGGALFTRTLTLAGGSDELIVDEAVYAARSRRSTARLESISGFAFVAGDVLLKASGGDAAWNTPRPAANDRCPGAKRDVARLDLRHDARRRARDPRLCTPLDRAAAWDSGRSKAAEAQRLLDANQP